MTCKYVFAYAGGVKFLATCSSFAGQTITYGDFLKSVGVSQTGQKKALELSVHIDEKLENKENSNEKKPKKRQNVTSTRQHSSKRRRSSRTVTLPLPISYCSRRRSGRSSRTSQRASASAGRLSLDTVLKKHRSGKCVAAPLKGELKEEDPIADELSDLSDLPENKSDHSTDYEDNIKTEEIPTDKGKLEIAKHGIRKRLKKVKKNCVSHL